MSQHATSSDMALTVRDDAMTPEIVDYDPNVSLSLGPVESAPVQQQQADPYYGAGSLDLTDKQRAELAAPFPPADLEILPAGEVYLPQVLYRRRLNEALGIGRWSLRPLADPKVVGKTVARWYGLYVEGKFVSEAFGEADFIENNPRATWGTALESAKSNALMRCCKDIGINLECWSKSFTENWKSRYAARIDGKWQKTSADRTTNTTSATQPGTSPGMAPVDVPQLSATPTAQQPSQESGTRSATTRTITPVKFDKGWKLTDGTRCQFLIDSDGTKWTLTGAAAIDAAEQAILSNKKLIVNFKKNKNYLNCESAEVVQ